MKKLLNLKLFILLFVLFSNAANASHIIGYDLCMVNIKDNSGNPTDMYKWRLKFYRDVTGIAAPANFSFTAYRRIDNTPVANITVTKINPTTYLTYPGPSSCVPAGITSRIELGVYESIPLNYAGLNSADNYYVSSQHATWSAGITNVLGASDQYGLLMTMDFPKLDAGSATRYNSSPEFKAYPLPHYLTGKPYVIDWQVEDPDGDSLVFSLTDPLDGPGTKPFMSIPYANGYGLNVNLMNGSPDITIDPVTGIVRFKTMVAGKYLIAFKVEEFRNGIKIGEVRRELQIEVVHSYQTTPLVEDQFGRKKFITDTISVSHSIATYVLNFMSTDVPDDSVFMRIEPDLSPNENIFNTALFDVQWGQSGNMLTGNAAADLVLAGKGSITGRIIWTADSTVIRRAPYHFRVISYDKSCPQPLYDTLQVSLLIKGSCFYQSYKSVTGCDSVAGVNGRYYYSTGIYIDTIRTAMGCDSIVVQNITVNYSAPSHPIIGERYPEVLSTHSYMLDANAGSVYTWYVSNGQLVQVNSNTATIQWNGPGYGHLWVTDSAVNGCVRINELGIQIGSVGIQTQAKNTWRVYPVPAENVLMIDKIENENHPRIEVLDINGRSVLDTNVVNNTIDISTLEKGIYFLRYNNGYQKIIKL